jgi:hypothetical protein
MFRFNENEPVSANVEAFLLHMEQSDAQMAAILRANIDKLISIVQNGERNGSARQDFNTTIALALDALIAPVAE